MIFKSGSSTQVYYAKTPEELSDLIANAYKSVEQFLNIFKCQCGYVHRVWTEHSDICLKCGSLLSTCFSCYNKVCVLCGHDCGEQEHGQDHTHSYHTCGKCGLRYCVICETHNSDECIESFDNCSCYCHTHAKTETIG